MCIQVVKMGYLLYLKTGRDMKLKPSVNAEREKEFNTKILWTARLSRLGIYKISGRAKNIKLKLK